MNDEQFSILRAELQRLSEQVQRNHSQQFEWAKTLNQMQIQLSNLVSGKKPPEPWTPFYFRSLELSPNYPEIFNKYGEKMEMFFMSDRNFSSSPNSTNSRYIIWDRYNYGLKTHFYTDDEIFRTVGKPERRFAILIEPNSIKPYIYRNVLQHKDSIEKTFDAIFTFDAEILKNLKNAKFFLYGSVWYGRGDAAHKIREDNYKYKTKNISMICSAKAMCEGHIRRRNLAFKVKNEGLADTFGKFDGGGYVPIELPLEEYRYSIAVENTVQPFYFTEKILNCFAAQTLPIYLGATEIGRYFNPAGIIQISIADCEHIEDILAKCTPEEYARRLPAVIDNFNRVKNFMNQTYFDHIYINYLRK